MNYLREMAEGGYHPEAIGTFHNVMVPWLAAHFEIGKSDAIVDIGAGQGHCLIPLHNAGYSRLIAVDVDDYNFAHFNQKYGIQTIKRDVSEGPLDIESGTVAAVYCFHLIEHLPTPTNLLTEAYRILRSGGKLFLVTPDWRKQWRTFYRDPTHIRPYDKEALMRLLQAHSFHATVSSWGTAYGLGRLKAYKLFPRLALMGRDILVVGEKT